MNRSSIRVGDKSDREKHTKTENMNDAMIKSDLIDFYNFTPTRKYTSFQIQEEHTGKLTRGILQGSQQILHH